MIGNPNTHSLQPNRDWRERLGEWGCAALRRLPPELAHDLAMWALERRLLDPLFGDQAQRPMPELRSTIPGLGLLMHPIGLAAGFDKNVRAPHSFARMGLAFLEGGTVTPRPQPGNPKPRLFRLSQQQALINRMGFNSDGAAVVLKRLQSHKWSHDTVPLGINVGKNKETTGERALDDYVKTIEIFAQHAKYFVVNLSSPNTPGLRDLASPEFIRLLAANLGNLKYQVWIKLDPDMDASRLRSVVEMIGSQGFQGIILSNTHRVEWPQSGGLSGQPLGTLASRVLETAYEVHRGSLPMIASGGILSGADVFQRLARGACGIQIYTALVYRGPWVVKHLLLELAAEMRLRGFASVEQVIGSHYLDS